MSAGAVDISHIFKSFRIKERKKLVIRPVLEDINFSIRPGEKVMIVGASGCGKSTLLRLVAGLEQAAAGSISIDGDVVNGPGADRGVVFQQSTLFPWMTVWDNIIFSRRLRISLNSRDEQVSRAVYRSNALVTLMGLERSVELYPNQLSGGMQQRANIARALVSSPKVLLMDEPFGALDAQTRETMHKVVNHLFNVEKTTVMFVTHDVEEAIVLGDKIIVLSANPGRVDSVFTTESLKRDEDGIVIKNDSVFFDFKEQILSRIRETTTLRATVDLLQRVAKTLV
ncbi:MAG: ATP-binding cassette domain-containing protein [Acidithiobacillus ferriphilus]|jgi:NitT/TauT family transport system ATP-binding protein|uniref:ABC transporter ATP-binding protein n=1 Tax=Acidithiobacillus ferriphilus TaxID=1689834 RepID=UPI00242F1E9C|nr:ABC transporter ATP-binding protein [Acidithiobacillus ferriphilus]MBW9248808.1 ATP-binding cassette domain-containing protein [Acidithiobacillus ferriphilus]MBW9254601.1 ATP-binding cassette domain-containing protein [Acidithiobacillus ferriphilus]